MRAYAYERMHMRAYAYAREYLYPVLFVCLFVLSRSVCARALV